MKRFFLILGMLLVALPAHAQAPSVWIDDLTWPEVRDAIAAGKRTAIIYVGSSEQNGPHMVIGKHNFIARALAQRIAEQLGDALVYPIMPYAVAGNAVMRTGHMRFPGTVSLPPEVFFGVVRGVAQSALTAGFKVVALMGDHGGGQDELALAAKELDAQARLDGARVLFIGDLYAKSRTQMRDILASRGLPNTDDHAGIPDTSSLLYLARRVGPQGQDRARGCQERGARPSAICVSRARQGLSGFEGRSCGQADPDTARERQIARRAQ
jgi:creatinine amidohydrolase